MRGNAVAIIGVKTVCKGPRRPHGVKGNAGVQVGVGLPLRHLRLSPAIGVHKCRAVELHQPLVVVFARGHGDHRADAWKVLFGLSVHGPDGTATMAGNGNGGMPSSTQQRQPGRIVQPGRVYRLVRIALQGTASGAIGNQVMAATVRRQKGNTAGRQPGAEFQVQAPVEVPRIAMKEAQAFDRGAAVSNSRGHVGAVEGYAVNSRDFHQVSEHASSQVMVAVGRKATQPLRVP
jgi:hypothetical protein